MMSSGTQPFSALLSYTLFIITFAQKDAPLILFEARRMGKAQEPFSHQAGSEVPLLCSRLASSLTGSGVHAKPRIHQGELDS